MRANSIANFASRNVTPKEPLFPKYNWTHVHNAHVNSRINTSLPTCAETIGESLNVSARSMVFTLVYPYTHNRPHSLTAPKMIYPNSHGRFPILQP